MSVIVKRRFIRARGAGVLACPLGVFGLWLACARSDMVAPEAMFRCVGRCVSSSWQWRVDWWLLTGLLRMELVKRSFP